MIMRVGVTGTREGLTDAQKATAELILTGILKNAKSLCTPELHHGDCVGADAQIHDIATALGFWTVAHPPTAERYRAWCQADNIMAKRPYLVRNRNIVDDTHVLVAFPKEMSEARRGGTWWTVRYAYKAGRVVVVVWPDGRQEGEGS